MNTITPSALGQLSDQDVLAHIHLAVQAERRATVHLVALLIELDRRRLYLGEGCSSLFTYCTQALHLSEHAAYNRIETARAARRFPLILDLLAAGEVTLTAIRLLAPHLKPENHQEVLARARHKGKREVELLVATLHPQPDVASAVRKLPASRSATPSAAIASPPPATEVRTPRPAEVKPLAPERYKIQFTVSRQTYEKLRRAQDLLRHSVPDGDPAAIFDRALALLVTELERSKTGATDRPRTARRVNAKSRHVPASIKRVVWLGDGGRCAFSGPHGRCTATGFLEYHHVVPFAAGGETSAGNLELRCRAHNQYEADRYFGPLQGSLMREERAVYGVIANSFRNELAHQNGRVGSGPV